MGRKCHPYLIGFVWHENQGRYSEHDFLLGFDTSKGYRALDDN